MQILENLASIANDYDAVLCDVWGVIHNGRRVFPEAAAALQRFRASGKHVVLITNAPKPRDPIPGQLDRIGFPRDGWDRIVTSGDAIRMELSKRSPGPMYKIGPPTDAALWDGLGLALSPLSEAKFIGISGLNDDARESPEDYADTLRAAKARELEMLCANPDIVVRVGEHLVWCAGAIARDYAALGGAVVMAGKPHPPIYALALQELAGVSCRSIDRRRILCIGDGVGTDVAGAAREGLDCLFIASGMHGESLMQGGALSPEKVEAALAAEGVEARFAAPFLA